MHIAIKVSTWLWHIFIIHFEFVMSSGTLLVTKLWGGVLEQTHQYWEVAA